MRSCEPLTSYRCAQEKVTLPGGHAGLSTKTRPKIYTAPLVRPQLPASHPEVPGCPVSLPRHSYEEPPGEGCEPCIYAVHSAEAHGCTA